MNKIKWIGTVSNIIGAFLVAAGITTIGYPIFLFAAVLWSFAAYKQKDNALLVLNGFFMTANILGVYNAFYH